MKLPEIFGIFMIELTAYYNLFFTTTYDDNRTICFEEIGCFNCEPPFSNYLYRSVCAVPERNTSIQYLLYTRQSPNVFFPLDLTNTSIASAPFDAKLPTKILIPGFNTTLAVDPEFYRIKDELLKENPYNVIIVDWTSDDNFPYVQALANGRKVGAYIALLLKRIKENKGIDYKSVHMIGHSLGAHVAGWAGKILREVAKVGRITGLDPAGPHFQHAPDAVRLDKNDADFVDIIHTNGGNNMIEGFGLYQAIGDVDFYVNGGNHQPLCGESTIFNVLDTAICDHNSALKYFKTSINKCRFPSVLCTNYENFKNGHCNCNNSVINDMGFHARKIHTQGINTLKFYLYTTASSPYCKEPNKCPVSKDLNKSEGLILQIIKEVLLQLFYLLQRIRQFVHLFGGTVPFIYGLRMK